ncbi:MULTISPECIES: hypothetical protein [unclassified Leeuwenhoekiella]|uniref:hypothetical protein n=1 Tax=unclassified Leeuwenhoekiella TaxID=2615029 RepID=UPI000C52DE75|nr:MULTISPECIES: hypothetical protein [unclassified Leeuwenhoekiella]MBA80427.1 hypothetical protein [Leeuwenhoekiella sp.]|tara:strand:- start:14387 stop:14641 length:255 start_codon:yes stop_codon:yes gene_type:complete
MNDIYSQPQNPLGAKRWALYIFISSIPIVGFIMLLVWAFSSSENLHLQEWAKGKLLIALIVLIIVLGFLFLAGGIGILTAVFNQ